MAETVFAYASRALGAPLAIDGHGQFETVGDLAVALDPSTKQTAALGLIDEALARVAAGEIDRLIISMPPQEGKSERVTHYGATWFLQRNPDLRLGIVSFDGNVAAGFSQKIRNDIVTFDGADGNVDLGLRLRRDSKAASRWWLDAPHRGGCYAIGIGGALTGRPVDVLLIDDPVKDYKAADSELQSEDAWQWWMSVARPRLAPGAPVILILTRWHERDLAGRLLAKQAEDEASGAEDYDRWTVINIPAQADHNPARGETDPLGREPGEFMVSARGRTDAQWRATKVATSSRIWTALYQGRPSPQSGDVWRRPWWRRYTSMLWTTDGEQFRVDGFDEVIQSWDLAFKDTKGSDYVVGLVLARKGPDVYVLDETRGRLAFSATLAAFLRLSSRWPQATLKLVEDKANGPAVMDALRSKVGGIVPVDPGSDSKYARAVAVSPFVEGGNVFLPSSDSAAAPGVALFDVEALVEEAAQFPRGAHDDQVDALSQGLRRLLLDGLGAAEWIAYMKRRAAEANEPEPEAEATVTTLPVEPEPEPVVELPPGVSPMRAAREAALRAAGGDSRPRR